MIRELKNIIFFEDDPLDCEIFHNIVSDLDKNINCVFYPDDRKIEALKEFNPINSLILLDLNLKNIDGITLYKTYLEDLNFTVYIHTSSDNPKDIIIAGKSKISGYFQKQLKHKDIQAQLKSLIFFYQYNLKHLY